MRASLVAFASGLLFALGLGVSGMTQPAKIQGFLDVAGSWDPSLAFVMAGAVLLGLVSFAAILRRRSPVLDGRFHLPETKSIDGRLVGGAALFGLGWGLSGYCPGPAVVSVVTGAPGAIVFVSAMVVGMVVFSRVRAARATSSGPAASMGGCDTTSSVVPASTSPSSASGR
jgi:uncharacterized membrane protein YedE/YeeE